MKIVFLFLLCCVSIAAQTRAELQKKYGAPFYESYEVSPGILAKATYSKTGQICYLTFEPKARGSKFPESKHDLLSKLVDELVPAQTRGANQLSGFLNMGDGGGSLNNYENLSITYWITNDKEISYFISWKEKSCVAEFGEPWTFRTDRREKESQ